MDSLIPYALIDTVLFIVAVMLLVRRGAFWHPLTMYLLFHGYTVTWRAWQLVAGAPPLYYGQPEREVITSDELVRAVIYSDLALIAFAAGCWWGYKVADSRSQRPVERRPINRTVIFLVCLFCLPAGVTAFLSIQAGNFSDNFFTQTQYFAVMAMWPFGCLSLLIAAYGFRTVLVVPLGLYLFVVGTQGYHRHMLLLPLIFLTCYFLQGRDRRWPNVALLVAAACLLLIFPRLKQIGRAYQAGDNQEALHLVTEAFVTKSSYEEAVSNEQFLDQMAGAISLVDDAEVVFKGRTYLAVLTLPVPRTVWKGKPGLADHLEVISTPLRPFIAEGRIITYTGEAYFNFRLAGVLLAPLLLAYVLTVWCMRATAGPMDRFGRYVYCVFVMSFLQLYRDGFASLVVFTICHNLPMVFAWVLHSIPGFAPKVVDLSREQAAELPAGGPYGPFSGPRA